MEQENSEIDTMIEEDVMGTERNWVLGKIPGIPRDDPNLDH